MSKTLLVPYRRFRQLISLLGIALFAFILTWGIPQTLAQQTLPSDINPVTSVIRVGNTISAPVVLDGYELFRVAGSINIEADQKNQGFSIKDRAELIENELHAILDNQLYGGAFARGFDPKTLTITIKTQEGKTALFASDQDQLQERKILEVTPEDAQYNGYAVTIWANKLTVIIRNALLKGYEQRQPPYLYQASLWSLGVILGSGLLSFGVYILQKRLWKQYLIIVDHKPEFNLGEDNSNTNTTAPNNSSPIPEANEQKQRWDNKRHQNQYKRLVLKLSQVLIWTFALWRITSFFPHTRSFSIWLSKDPFYLLVIFLFVGIAIRISGLIIDGLLKSFQEHYSLSHTVSHRRELRFVTYSVVVKGVITFSWIILGFILALDSLEIPVAPIIAGLGIVGLALSFGSQNLVRDVIHGTFILLEDQYAVGDYITVDGISGYVEYMNLRITQIRGQEGRLTTFPNGSINIVHNQTKDWARIDFKTTITYQSDINVALEVMKKVIEEMSNESGWKNSILIPVVTSGVSNLTDGGVELEMKIKTRPNFQWEVAREFRRRLKFAFEQQGIEFGSGKVEQVVFLPEVSQWLNQQNLNKG